jgi:hypothetical protein
MRMLSSRGFQLFSLGERTLRTDTACVALISVLEYVNNTSVARPLNAEKPAAVKGLPVLAAEPL